MYRNNRPLPAGKIMTWKQSTINAGELLRQLYPDVSKTIRDINHWSEEDWDRYFEKGE